MIAIRAEIAAVESGDVALADSPLVHAPHTMAHADRRLGPGVLARARRVPGREDPPTSTGLRSVGSTRRTATATSSASVPIRRRSPRTLDDACTTRRRARSTPRRDCRAGAPRRAGSVAAGCDVRRGGSLIAGRRVGDVGRPVPDRLDHQDLHRRAGDAAARRGPDRPQRPARVCTSPTHRTPTPRSGTCWRIGRG